MKHNPIYRTWRLQLFTSMLSYTSSHSLHNYDVLLVDETMEELITGREAASQLENVREQHRAIIMISLVTQKSHNKLQLIKFQPLSSLLHHIQTIIDSNKQSANHRKIEKSMVITIGSSLAFCGKTTFSLHVAQLIAAHQSKVFYLNLERFNSASRWLSKHEEDSGSYSDLLYLLKSNPSDVNQWFKTHRNYDAAMQIEYLQPFVHREDRSELLSQDALGILQVIINSGLYDYIVVDMEAGYAGWNEPLLLKSSMHYMMLLSNEQWLNKHFNYMKDMKLGHNDILEKLEQFSVKVCTGEGLATPQQLERKGLIELPFIENWQVKLPELISDPLYRAAVEHCIGRTIMNRDVAI